MCHIFWYDMTIYDVTYNKIKTEIALDWCDHINSFIEKKFLMYFYHHCTNKI